MQTMKWQELSSASSGRFKHAVFSFNDKIYIHGGQTKTQINTDSIEVYNIASDSWNLLPVKNYSPKIDNHTSF